MAGNITKIKEGHYRLRYQDCSRYIKARSDREAEKLLAKFVTEIDEGDLSKPAKVTFRQFAGKWLTTYAEIELAPKTVDSYKQLLNSRIYKALGEKKLNKIKPLDLVSFYNSLRKEHFYINTKGETKASPGLSENSIKHYHQILSAIFEKAIKWEVFSGTSPTRRVDSPKVEKKKAACYDEDQVQGLLEALDKIDPEELKYKVATMIALLTGARLGEVMGLEWQDIDFNYGSIEIRRVSQYLPQQGVFTKKPKNESSKRRISVNSMLLEIINEYQEAQKEKGFTCKENNRLFIRWDGKAMHPHTVTKWFPEFLKRNELPHLNFHGLRHTSATFLISKGMDIETVAGRLGHSTSATTHNIYSHFLESKDRAAADLMEKSFSPNKEDKN